LPLITISIVRTISFTIYTSTKRILNAEPGPSSGIDASSEGGSPPWIDLRLGLFNKDTAGDVAMTSLLAGGASGAVVCVGSAPFELVKVGPPRGFLLNARSGDSSNIRFTETRTPRRLRPNPQTAPLHLPLPTRNIPLGPALPPFTTTCRTLHRGRQALRPPPRPRPRLLPRC
jgi:hypothetical protein